MSLLTLAETRKGRVLIHLIALVRDHKTAWHMAGILREIKGV